MLQELFPYETPEPKSTLRDQSDETRNQRYSGETMAEAFWALLNHAALAQSIIQAEQPSFQCSLIHVHQPSICLFAHL
jgi:hypothetical protein